MRPYGLFKETFYTYRDVQTQDSGGSVVSGFSQELELTGNIQPYSSSEAVRAGREFSNSMKVIFCKEDSDILMSDRVFYNNIYYDIVELEIWNDVYMKLILDRVK